MIARVVDALDERLRATPFLRSAMRKAFPDHWSFMLGEIALYCFLVLVATGTYLALLFSPSGQRVIYHGSYAPLDGDPMSEAFASVLNISFSVPAGLFIRQVHHWAALVFLAAIVVHLGRIFFTGAFRRPRDINWLIGSGLLMLAMLAGFTGYSLPDDLLSGTGLRIAYSVAESVPFVGVITAYLLFGGAYPTTVLTQRLFVTHIFIVPAAIAMLVGAHLCVVWRQKHTQFPGEGRSEDNVVGSPLWPNYALKSTGLLFFVVAVVSLLGGFVQINPVWMYGPYDASVVSAPAQPDWYVGWLEGALRIAPGWDVHLFGRAVPPAFVPGVVLPLVVFAVIICWPFIERRITRDRGEHHLLDRPSHVPWRTATGAAALAFAGILTFAGSDDVQAATIGMPVESLVAIYRVALVALPILTWLVTFELAREIEARRRALPRGSNRVVLRREERGGFAASDEPAERTGS
jgi:ubiquinol-cytochrome c reductase cytochrome b subunit